MVFQGLDLALEMLRHVAPGYEHGRDLHAQPRSRFGARMALDRRQAISLPGVGRDASPYSPLGLLQQFQVELRLESTGQVVAPQQSGSDRPGQSRPWRPRRCCAYGRPCNLGRHSSPGSSANRGTSALGRKQIGEAGRRAWPGRPESHPGRQHTGVPTRGTKSISSCHSGRRTLPTRPGPTGCDPGVRAS